MKALTVVANSAAAVSVPENGIDKLNATVIEAAFQSVANRAQVGIDHKNVVTGNPHGTTASDVGALPTAGTAANSSKLENNTLAQVTAAVLALAYPVGSYYINGSNGANPSAILGFGTWVSRAGQVIIGAGQLTDARGEVGNFAIGATGGEFKHVLTTAEMPAHNHDVKVGVGITASSTSQKGIEPSATVFYTTENKGGDQPHNNMQPYRVAYMWERTA